MTLKLTLKKIKLLLLPTNQWFSWTQFVKLYFSFFPFKNKISCSCVSSLQLKNTLVSFGRICVLKLHRKKKKVPYISAQ